MRDIIYKYLTYEYTLLIRTYERLFTKFYLLRGFVSRKKGRDLLLAWRFFVAPTYVYWFFKIIIFLPRHSRDISKYFISSDFGSVGRVIPPPSPSPVFCFVIGDFKLFGFGTPTYLLQFQTCLTKKITHFSRLPNPRILVDPN